MAKSESRTIVEYCPNCDTAIRFKKRPFRGQFITCPECGDVLEVVSESPLELDWAYTESDDFDDGGRDRDEFSDLDEEYSDDYGDYDDIEDYDIDNADD